jgi:hypothetical protein
MIGPFYPEPYKQESFMTERTATMEAEHHARWLALVPVAVVFAACLMLVWFMLPAAHDILTESYEPTKTLRFFYTHGHAQHKWGPMTGFVFAPVYTVLLMFYHLTGQLGRISSVYPFGFADPIHDLGALILAGRLTTLVCALAGVYYLTRTLQRVLASTLGPVLGVLLSLSTSMVLLEALVDTNPNGLMIAFFLFALANYAAIILNGLTKKRAVAMAFFYVASLSCKELTSLSFILPYLALIALGVFGLRRNASEGKRNLQIVTLSCFSALGFYLLINVVYAPGAWVERMRYVFGPLKDPAIWASASQTYASYLLQALWAAAGSLGWTGVLLLLISFVWTATKPSSRLLLLWLPFLSHLILTIATAGYMPPYFMLPLGPALCLPSAFVISRMIETSTVSESLQTITFASLTVLCAWMAFCATGLVRYSHIDSLVRTAVDEQIPSGSRINVVNLFSNNGGLPEPTMRRGVVLDPRPLFEIIRAPVSDRPDYLLISSEGQAWGREIKTRPARAAMLKKQIGFDYSNFTSYESLGYELTGVIRPTLPGWCQPYAVADSSQHLKDDLLIYHLRGGFSNKASAADAITATTHNSE